jgi:hypothetical protein
MDKVFGIVPATLGVVTFVWVFSAALAIILLGTIGLMASFAYQARHLTFTVNDDGLRIGPGLYGRFIPKEKVDAAGVRVVDMNGETAYKPRWRTNGAWLPGYNAGWFKLQNQAKALLFVTDRTNVVYIPTTDNYSVMLSVKDADEFAETLRRWK